jgi:hypothetical protein
MTMQELEEKYIDREINEDRLNYNFKMMGKFGPASIYTFSFNTDDYTVSADVCIERDRITGIVPDKEQRDDGWGLNPNPGPSEILPEEYDILAKYLDCVVR